MQITIGGCEGNVEALDPNGHQQGSHEDNENAGSAKPIDSFDIMTLDEVAKNLRCSKAHVSNLIKGKVRNASTLPAISLGRRKLVRRETLEQWKKANERGREDAMMPASPRVGAVNA